MNFEALCTQLDLKSGGNLSQQLERLKAWCNETISQDIEYTGSPEDQYKHYLGLAKQYLNFFMVNAAAYNVEDNNPEFDDWNAIQYAAWNGYDRFISQLDALPSYIIDKATPEDKGKMTALHFAATNGYLHTVQALLKQGASQNLININNELAIHVVLQGNDNFTRREAIFHALQTDFAMKAVDDLGNSVIHYIAAYGYDHLLQDCLQQDPNCVFDRNYEMQYPINKAIINKQITISQLLLNINDVSQLTDADDNLPLHYAAMSRVPELLEVCCDKTPDINCLNREKKTPLILAIEHGDIPSAQYLLSRGAKVLLTNLNGFSMLYYAIQSKDSDMMQWVLINIPIKSTQVEPDGKTCLEQIDCLEKEDGEDYSELKSMLLR